MPPKGVKRKAANGYKMPEKISEGTILATVQRKQFRVGKSIGVGGFGEIYLCSEDISKPVGDNATLALKIEPHENGPLFVEIHCYIRAGTEEAIENFKKIRGLKTIGMPCHRGSGSTTINGDKYRFLVMDRFGSDLEKIFQGGKNPFSEALSYNLAIKIIDVLEHIHSQDYVHNDIKAQNLLLGYGKGQENDVYLVDFGLATKLIKGGAHLEYQPDPKKAHDGTIEYLSRDAHIGTHSRRSDLEVLGFNLVHWMSGTLPWIKNLTSPDKVHKLKTEFMGDLNKSLTLCFGANQSPAPLLQFLEYVASLEFKTKPDYEKLRQIFKQGLKKVNCPLDGKLVFESTLSPKKVVKATKQSVVKTPERRAKEKTVVSSLAKKSPVKTTPIKRGTPKKVASKSPQAPKRSVASPVVAATNRSLVGVRECGTQTSPAFVKAAKAAKARKVAEAENGDKLSKRTPTSLKRGAAKSEEDSTSVYSNPTPAMAAMLAKRAAAEAQKGRKKPKL